MRYFDLWHGANYGSRAISEVPLSFEMEADGHGGVLAILQGERRPI